MKNISNFIQIKDLIEWETLISWVNSNIISQDIIDYEDPEIVGLTSTQIDKIKIIDVDENYSL